MPKIVTFRPFIFINIMGALFIFDIFLVRSLLAEIHRQIDRSRCLPLLPRCEGIRAQIYHPVNVGAYTMPNPNGTLTDLRANAGRNLIGRPLGSRRPMLESRRHTIGKVPLHPTPVAAGCRVPIIEA